MVDAKRPIKESGPNVWMSSLVIPSASVPEIGRTSARGRISGGTPTCSNHGEMRLKNASIAPDARNIVMDTSMPTKKGSKENAICTPSFPPSTNNSEVGSFFKVLVNRTSKINTGISHVLMTVRISILFPPDRLVIKKTIKHDGAHCRNDGC